MLFILRWPIVIHAMTMMQQLTLTLAEGQFESFACCCGRTNKMKKKKIQKVRKETHIKKFVSFAHEYQNIGRSRIFISLSRSFLTLLLLQLTDQAVHSAVGKSRVWHSSHFFLLISQPTFFKSIGNEKI